MHTTASTESSYGDSFFYGFSDKNGFSAKVADRVKSTPPSADTAVLYHCEKEIIY
jgi:hypothetical protein